MVSRSARYACALAATLFAGCADLPEAAPGARADAPAQHLDWLRRGPVITGARLVPNVDPGGLPAKPLGRGYVNFLRPTALAARGQDLLIADEGLRAVYRYTTTTLSVTPIPGETAPLNTRVAIGPDLSAFVLDPYSGNVRQYSRGGRLMLEYAETLRPNRVADIAVDPRSGRLLAQDGLENRLLLFNPAGRVAEVLGHTPGRIEADDPKVLGRGGVAASERGYFVIDGACSCVVAFARDGRRLESVGPRLRLPGPIAADAHGRVLVVDRFDNSLHLLAGGQTRVASAASLGLVQLSAIAIDGNQLYIADAAAARIAQFTLAPPARGAGAAP